MNDRHRYRVWDKESEIMSCDIGIHYTDFYDTNKIITEDGVDRYEADDNCVVMQCTGLKDRNGKLIYEGDLIRYCECYIEDEEDNPKWTTAIIKWFGEEDYPAFDLAYHDFDENGLSHLFCCGYAVEIVGNVHENAEMMGSRK